MSETTAEVSDLPTSPQSFTIHPPIEFQGQTYSELLLREPTTGENLRGAMQMRSGVTQESIMNRQHTIMSAVSGVPVPVIQKLPVSLFNKGWTYIESFLIAGLPTGGI